MGVDVADVYLPLPLAFPPTVRQGRRMVRANVEQGEWDWYYQLAPLEQTRVKRVMRKTGLGPDVVAAAAGFDDVEEWAVELVDALSYRHTAAAPKRTLNVVTFSDLVGPVEVADICGVKVDTVYQWATRGVLPPVGAMVSGTRLWARDVIVDWATASGRLAVDPTDTF